MPTVDELALKLVIDTAEFRRGATDAGAEIAKLKAKLQAAGDDIEMWRDKWVNANKELREGGRTVAVAADNFTKLRNEVLGLMTAFISTRALIEFTKRITEMDNAMGRAASASGIFISEFGAWQGAARAMGGPADTFTKALNNIQDALGAYHAGENSPFLAMMNRIRVDVAFAKDGTVDLETTLKRLAAWAKAQTDIPYRNFALGRLGFTPDGIAMISKGSEELEKFRKIAEQYQAGPADAKAAEARTLAFYQFSAAVEQTGRSILTHLTPQIIAAADGMRLWLEKNKEWLATDVIGTLGAIARDIRAVVEAINSAVQATTGWQTAIEVMLGMWAFGKIAPVLRSIGLINTALGVTGGTLVGVTALLKSLPGLFFAAAAAFGIKKGLDDGSDWLRDKMHGEGTSDRLDKMHEEGRQQFLRWLGFGGGDKPAGAGITPGVSRSQSGVAPEVGQSAADAIEYLVREKGWDQEHAAAAIGSGIQESGLNPQAGAGTAHQGTFQWDAERRADIERHFGKALMSMSGREHLDALDYELRYGKEQEAGREFFAARGLDAANRVFTERVERPGNYGMETPNRLNLSRRAQEEYQRDNQRAAEARKRADDKLREIGRTPAAAPVITSPEDEAKKQANEEARRQSKERLHKAWEHFKAHWWDPLGVRPDPPPPTPSPDVSLRGALHPSAFQGGSSTSTTTDNSRTATTHINGPITVQTQANDADGIARGLRSALQRNSIVAQADYGIA